MVSASSAIGDTRLKRDDKEVFVDPECQRSSGPEAGGQDIFIMATLCESRIEYLKNKRAGWYGPVAQADLFSAMCSEECLLSDELHKKALSLSRCTCADVSAETFVRHDFCLESSARLLCTHLSECGHWGCQLEDFNCLRNEWDHLYPCSGSFTTLSIAAMVLLALVAVWIA